MQTIQRKILPRNPRSKDEWKENFREKNWVYLARLSSFLGVLKNAVQFARGKCRKFPQANVLLEWKAPKVSFRKLYFGHYVFSSSYELIFILFGECCICG